MKLEPELIKKILEWCEDNLPEKSSDVFTAERLIVIKGYTPKQISFHVKLLVDNGYIEASRIGLPKEMLYYVTNLTLDGYQYLELLRSKALTTAKNTLRDIGVIFTEGAIKALISTYIQTTYGGK